MKQLNKLSVLILFVLMACSQGQNKNISDQKLIPDSVMEKQAPVFTPSELPYPFSSAVQVGDILFLSGEIGDAGNGTGVVPGGIEAETHQMFKRIKATLSQHGLGLEDVFKCTVMLADMSEWQAFNEIYAGYFEQGRYPTRSAMGVSGLALGARVEMECWAYNPQQKKLEN
jgi:reactive intermediate/imine deaminase